MLPLHRRPSNSVPIACLALLCVLVALGMVNRLGDPQMRSGVCRAGCHRSWFAPRPQTARYGARGLRGGQVAPRVVMDRPLDYKEHLAAVGDNYKQLMEELVALGQNHIFEQWPAPGTDDDKKEEMMKQLEDLDKKTPGGLIDYIKRSTDLLEKAQKGGNNLKGFVPSVPTGERLKVGDEKFRDMEITGMTEAAHSAFVLVAGGLGERLGFGGIKVSLPSEVVTEKPFLQLYAEHILALQARAREGSGDRSLKLPLAIMTSGDTHQRTVDLLEANDYFGLDKDQVTLLEQQKVPAMNNKNAHLALDPENPYRILTKPHGHGDVHTLLHQSGTAKKWASEGRRWVVFFQDTNGLIFQAVPALIGVSKRLELEVNTLTVPRRPGEAVGSICHLKNNENGKQLTVNVEYNQLEGLLKSTVSPEGDVPSPETGYSPYPGNTNALVFRVEPYVSVLEKTGGLMPEFVNPKFKDDARVTFKKPTRLECMMQDYPLLLERDARVGFTQLERWACFASAKNNAADAASQFEKTGFAESASTAEAAIYDMFAQKLRRHGANVEEGEKVSFNGVPTLIGPKIILAPSFSTSYDELCRKFVTPEKVSISKSSTLYLDGRDIEVKSLDLDGTLSVKAVPGAHVVIDGLKIENKGWPLVSVDANDKSVSEKLRIRGYTIDRVDEEKVSYVFDKPGEYSLP